MNNPYGGFQTSHFELIEIIVGANGIAPGANATIPFKNQDQLQTYLGGKTVYIKAVETYSDQVFATSPISSGVAVATVADMANAAVTFTIKGKKLIDGVPMSRFNLMWADTGAAFVPYTFNPFCLRDVFEVDWTKSFVQVIAAPVAVPFSYLFGIHYSDQPN